MLAHLKVLKINRLQNLLGICPENYHLRYPSLVKLSCSDCPKLTTSCINETVSSKQIQQYLNRGVALDKDQQNPLTSNLIRLELHDLPQFEFIWSGSTPKEVLNFQFLQLLELDRCANLKSVFSMSIEKSLPELTSLNIYSCEELEEIMVENEEPQNLSNTEASFPKLSELVIMDCNKLKSLFSVAMIRMPPQLSTLHISEAAQLEVVFRHSSKGYTHNEDQIMLPNLRKLELEKLPSFVNIFQGFNFQAPKLQELSTNECPKFGPILRGTQVISLHHTTEKRQVFCLITATWSELCDQKLSTALEAFLNLEVLGEIKSRAQGIFHLQVEGEISSNTEWKPLYSNLQVLELYHLPELRFIWNGLSKFMSLVKLRRVSLVNCPKLKIIFSSAIVRCLPNLKRLSILNCEDLEEIMSSNLENVQFRYPIACLQQEVCCFPQLDYIEVKQCSKVKCLFYGFKACHFPKLWYLGIEKCSQLEQAFEFKIEASDKRFQRETSEDAHLILFPDQLHLKVLDCPKYSLTSSESRTSYPPITTQEGQVFWLITPSSNLQAFLTLRELHLTKSRAEGIFQLQVKGGINSNSEWKPLNSNLWKLMLHDLPELRFIWKGFSKFLSLEKLVEVSLVECPKLKIVFSDIVRCLPDLRNLFISNCEELEGIMSSDSVNAQISCPQHVVCFPRLMKIEVKQCNKLKCLFYDSMTCHFPELKSLEIEECSQLKQVFGYKGEIDFGSSQREADEDKEWILFPKLRKLVLKGLPIFFEISARFNLLQPLSDYLVMDCPKYNLNSTEASTSCQHTTAQGASSDESVLLMPVLQ